MSTARAIIEELGRRGVRLWLEEGRLLYQAPKGVMDPATKARLKEHKAEIMAALAAGAGGEEAARELPLSFGQERLWLAEELAQGDGTYNCAGAMRLRGELDLAALTDSLHHLTRRHQALRTTFPLRGDLPVQVIAPPPREPRPPRLHDLGDLPPESRWEEALRQIEARAEAGFDLERGPLWTADLWRLEPGHWVLLMSMHHIICDGWSLGVLIEELCQLYSDLSQGRLPSLAPLTYQYGDFAVWQRNHLRGRVEEGLREWWSQNLAGAPRRLDLPLDKPRPPVPTFRGAEAVVPLKAGTLARVQETCAQTRLTPYMFFLAVYCLLLHQRTGQDDLLLGSPSAGRDRPELERLVGFLVNSLALRVRIRPGLDLPGLLEEVRQTCLGAMAHQDFPFDRLVQEILASGKAGRVQPIQAAFALDNTPRSGFELPGLTAEPVPLPLHSAKTDLSLHIDLDGGEARGLWEYNRDLFRPETMAAWSRDYRRLLEAALERPRAGLDEVLGACGLAVRQPTTRIAPKAGQETAIYRLAREGGLTANQAAIWLRQQIQPENNLFVQAAGYEIHGPLDPAAMQAAWQDLVAGHDLLRAVILNQDGRPSQVFRDQGGQALSLVDLTGEPDPDAALAALVARDKVRVEPLDGAHYASVLYRLGPERHLWYLKTHQVFVDGVSIMILLRRFGRFYQRRLAGEAPPLEAFPAFATAVAQDAAYGRSDQYGRDRDFWARQLALEPEVPELLGRPAPPPGTAISKVALDLGQALSRRLAATAAELAQGRGSDAAALFNAAAAGLAALLHRAGGIGRVGLGVVLHNRRSESDWATVGPFITVLPLMLEVAATDSLGDLVGQVRQGMLALRPHARYRPASTRQRPLYSAQINFQVMRITEFDGLPVDFHEWPQGHGDDPLALEVADFKGSGRLTAHLSLPRDTLSPDERGLLARYYRRILRALAEDPATRVGQVELASPGQRRRLAAAGLGPRRDPAPGETVLTLWRRAAMENPGHPALTQEGRGLSHGELAGLVERLAGGLIAAGVGRGAVVGLLLERSPEQIATLLAVLTSGAAYLPLEARQPPARLAAILADAGAGYLITRRGLAPELEAPPGTRVLDLDDLLAAEAAPPPPREVRPEDPAYVIYTSGSTGRPKGVVVGHGALANFVTGAIPAYGLEREDRVAHLATLAFDASLEEILPALSLGGTVVLRGEEWLATVEDLLAGCDQNQVTVLSLPTALWVQMVNHLAEGGRLPASLSLVLVGGEAMPLGAVRQWARLVGPHPRLMNTYGPTEATVVATAGLIPGDPAVVEAWREVPIGRPLANLEARVLEPSGRAAPPGVAGELHLGGAGLAQGYLGDAALTAQRFVPDPAGADSGARLFRTGDLVRQAEDGTLYFQGRADGQVKIRGFRVELGEVEAALAAHPRVAAAGARFWRPESGEAQLAGYWVERPAGGELPSLTPAELRRFLARTLPDYMIPGAWLRLDELPLTPGGKVDRKALPRPEDHADQGDYQAPRNQREADLAAIMAQVLGRERVGVRDDFFTLGGHSLLATRMLGMVRSRLGGRITLAQLYRHPTVAGMARSLAVAPDLGGERPLLVPLAEGPAEDPGAPVVICLPPAGGQPKAYLELAGRLEAGMAVWALRSPGFNQGEEPEDDMERLTRAYAQEVLPTLEGRPALLLGWSVGGVAAVSLAHRLAAAGSQSVGVALVDALAPHLYQRPQGPEDAVDLLLMVMPPEDLGDPEEARALSPEQLLALVNRAARREGLIQQDLSQEEMGSLLAIFGANSRAAREASLAPWPGPALLLQTEETARQMDDPRLGWGGICPALEVVAVGGLHPQLMEPPWVEEVAETVLRWWEGVWPRP